MLRLRRVGRGDRGASAVEFAIVVPLLLLILLGILEFAFVLRDDLSVSSAVRVGARTAASGAGAGKAVCPPIPDGLVNCPFVTDTPQLAQSAANAIQKAGSAMPQGNIDEIWVYKANASGFAGQATTLDQMTASGGPGCVKNPTLDLACVKYVWRDSVGKFQYASGGWDSETIDGCIANPDSVGVYMKATHPFFTGFFSSTITMKDYAVQSFEPLPANVCDPGKHA
jgi:hypothetical protein